MEYVGVEERSDCLFCRVIENPDEPDAGLVVWRREGAIVLLNKFPYNPGHAMASPVAHVPCLAELHDAQSLALMRVVRRTVTVLRTTVNLTGSTSGPISAMQGEPAFRIMRSFTSSRTGTATRI